MGARAPRAELLLTSVVLLALSVSTVALPGCGGRGGASSRPAAPHFSPYVDVTLSPPRTLLAARTASRTPALTLAFVVAGAGACRPTWGASTAIDDPGLRGAVAQLGREGIAVAISFGGRDGSELARSCGTPAALAMAYQSVIDRFGATSVDFDIEGGAAAEPASVDRRSEAIAAIQASARRHRRPLRVALTVAVLPRGLDGDGLRILRSALAHGARPDLINLLAMDYGDQAAPRPAGRMGTYAIQAATAVHSQLRALLPARSDAARWQLLGLTPMLGINDTASETFGLADARRVARFARDHRLGLLSMWSLGRDRSCSAPSGHARAACSGIAQAPYAFAHALGGS